MIEMILDACQVFMMLLYLLFDVFIDTTSSEN